MPPVTKDFEILLLEDEPADAYLVQLAIRESKINATITHLQDGREGLDYLRRISPYTTEIPPDLILLDINMPRMNGREFLSNIKMDAQLKNIPVIILTTSDVERDINTSYRLGACGYITKPVDFSQLIDVMSGLNAYWFELVRLPTQNLV